MSTAVSINKQIRRKKPKLSRAASLKAKKEDMEIVLMLEQLKNNLDHLHNTLDNITDPILIDSCVYEMKALHMKYKYYLMQYKNRELATDV